MMSVFNNKVDNVMQILN